MGLVAFPRNNLQMPASAVSNARRFDWPWTNQFVIRLLNTLLLTRTAHELRFNSLEKPCFALSGKYQNVLCLIAGVTNPKRLPAKMQEVRVNSTLCAYLMHSGWMTQKEASRHRPKRIAPTQSQTLTTHCPHVLRQNSVVVCPMPGMITDIAFVTSAVWVIDWIVRFGKNV